MPGSSATDAHLIQRTCFHVGKTSSRPKTRAPPVSHDRITLEFLPAMPPRTVKGKVMSAQMTRMMQMVPKGRAAVERYTMATVLRKEKVASMGPQNNAVVSSTLRTQLVPPIILYDTAAT